MSVVPSLAAQALPFAAAVTPDASTAIRFMVLAPEPFTINPPVGAPVGQAVEVEVTAGEADVDVSLAGFDGPFRGGRVPAGELRVFLLARLIGVWVAWPPFEAGGGRG